MKALDTNALVRFLVRDDEKQSQAVRRILLQAGQENTILFFPAAVALETIWVLSAAYNRSREALLQALEELLALPSPCLSSKGGSVSPTCVMQPNLPPQTWPTSLSDWLLVTQVVKPPIHAKGTALSDQDQSCARTVNRRGVTNS